MNFLLISLQILLKLKFSLKDLIYLIMKLLFLYEIILINMKNPQSSRTIQLPIVTPANYQQYNQEKKDRIDLQKKRKELQQTVSYLRRHAVQTNKQFNQTQLDLYKLYKKKAQNYEQREIKTKHKKLSQKHLEERKNLSSLSRYLHSVKKEQAIKQIKNKKKSMVQMVRKNHQEKEQLKKINDSRVQQLQREKNKNLNETVRNGTFYAKVKLLNDRKKVSKTVRSNMISLQQQMKNRELQKILTLQQKKEQLSKLVKKQRKGKDVLESMKSEVDIMDPKQVFTMVQPKKERDSVSIRSLSKSLKKSKNMNKSYYQ